MNPPKIKGRVPGVYYPPGLPDEAFDECACGDFRYQHEPGGGRCTLNGLGHHGGDACGKFCLDTVFKP